MANSVDRVSLLTFPAVTTATVADDYNCGIEPLLRLKAYALPFPATSTYQIVNFSSDYRTSDRATSLSSSSNIVEAAGGKCGCAGLQAIGGVGTYYAQVIYAAQAALVAEQALFPTSQNVIILLSDGDANATSADMPGPQHSSGSRYTRPRNRSAIRRSRRLKPPATAGTRVYSVAYGAEASGCTH